MSAAIAVVDDEPRMVDIISMVLRRAGYEVHGFTDPEGFLRHLETAPVDLLISDLKMPRVDGVDLLRRSQTLLPGLPVILITAHATVRTAIAALKAGAYDYVQKPFDNEELKELVARALEHRTLRLENRHLRAAASGTSVAVVAQSPAMKKALSLARRVAASSSTVLITGESGTGKEVLARLIHDSSPRADKPWVAVNCKAIADSLFESEVFGHEKGAFTGADRARAGVFERAEGGTVFLDEIGEIALDLQGKLLRVLQEKEVMRVGATRATPIDVRVIAATNRDLHSEVEKGDFRDDLYFRLAVIPVALAPLRQRREDILPLAQEFLRRIGSDIGKTFQPLDPNVVQFLLSHSWPGNVRELANAMERGAVLAEDHSIRVDDLRLQRGSASHADEPSAAGALPLSDFLDRAAGSYISQTLQECGNKRIEAARALGIDRTTLYRMMRKYGID